MKYKKKGGKSMKKREHDHPKQKTKQSILRWSKKNQLKKQQTTYAMLQVMEEEVWALSHMKICTENT